MGRPSRRLGEWRVLTQGPDEWKSAAEPTPADQSEAVSYCPWCGAAIAGVDNLVVEYWVSRQTIFFCWCSSCHRTSEIAPVDRVFAVEPDAG